MKKNTVTLTIDNDLLAVAKARIPAGKFSETINELLRARMNMQEEIEDKDLAAIDEEIEVSMQELNTLSSKIQILRSKRLDLEKEKIITDKEDVLRRVAMAHSLMNAGVLRD